MLANVKQIFVPATKHAALHLAPQIAVQGRKKIPVFAHPIAHPP
jgi:hypothetical protein